MKFQDLGNPKTRIETQEQAQRRVEELCREVVRARKECDAIQIDGKPATVEAKDRLYARWLMLYGQAIGTVIAYYQCGRLQDVAYQKLKDRVQATLAVTFVGAAHAPSHDPRVQVVRRVPNMDPQVPSR